MSSSASDPQGLAFASLAEDYERGRYGWPPEIAAVDATTVLDLAAGTGKLTSVLVERYDDVVAVEPDLEMLALLERRVPRARAMAGSAERIPLDDVSVDAVFVAEAFHWFDSAVAAGEIARVLRPGGTLLVCFNEWRSQWRPAIGEEARAVIERWAARLPSAGGVKVETGTWRAGIDEGPFGELVERTLDHMQRTDGAGVVAYYLSVSSFATLPPEEHARFRRELEQAVPDVPYELPLRARSYLTRRR